LPERLSGEVTPPFEFHHLLSLQYICHVDIKYLTDGLDIIRILYHKIFKANLLHRFDKYLKFIIHSLSYKFWNKSQYLRIVLSTPQHFPLKTDTLNVFLQIGVDLFYYSLSKTRTVFGNLWFNKYGVLIKIVFFGFERNWVEIKVEIDRTSEGFMEDGFCSLFASRHEHAS
jgi:hypothetical protein